MLPMSLLCIAWKKQSNLCAALNLSLGCLWFEVRGEELNGTLQMHYALCSLCVNLRSGSQIDGLNNRIQGQFLS